MLMFHVGSRDENTSLAGISHVLEHMHYKGTKKRSTSQEVAEFIESIGGEHNAFTSKEYTGYYVKVAAKHIEDSFDFLSDLIVNPLFRSEDLEQEKKVILQELSMYQDIPMEIVANKFENLVFGDNALGRDIIGRRESIESTTRDDLLGYRARYYHAGNAVLVIAGNFEISKIKDKVAKLFTLPSGKKVKRNPLFLDKPQMLGLTKKKIEQSQVCAGFLGASTLDEDRFALRLLTVILGDSMSSRMFVEIREKRNLAYAIKTSASFYLESGAIETQAGVAHANVYEVIEGILHEYEKIKSVEVNDSELQKAKEIITGKLLIAFEDSEQVANHFAFGELFSRENLTPSELLVKYNKVTTKDIHRVAKKYFIKENLSVAVLTPNDITKKVTSLIQGIYGK